MEIIFEHDYQQKILSQTFAQVTFLGDEKDVLAWRQTWLDALKSWHSPYKAVINAQLLSLSADADHDALKRALLRMEKVLAGFFLKKSVVWGANAELSLLMPFECVANEEAAWEAIGLRKKNQASESVDFRASIQLQNHFRQHVVEMNFSSRVKIETKDQLQILRGKLTNNLMHWHSAWSLLIDCSQLEIIPELKEDWELMLRFFKGFFLKEVLGYAPLAKDLHYPFPVYRSRHNAAGRLEAEGLFSGGDADCKTRKNGESEN
ncbi:MAG: hypothetical protein NTX25_03880 [Proteobacteria bacterium]|nr:hypothetical protein [Pseudomonadota bacterium]